MRFFRLVPAVSVVALVAACMPAGPARTTAEPAAAEGTAKPEVVMEEAAFEAAPVASGRTYAGGARRGVLTAGDIDDVLNLGAFTRYVARMAPDLGLPKLGLGAPVLAQLTGPQGDTAPGARYTLRRPGAAEPFHEGYAGPDGRIAVFPAVLGAGALGQAELRVFSDDGQEIARQVLASGARETVVLPEGHEWRPDFLDLVLVVDTTGSMGDEIAFLQRELIGATRAAARRAPGVSIRYGLVAYRDAGDAYVVKNHGFTGDGGTMAGWLRGLSADGGGDYPEAAAAALRAGVGLTWRRGKGERLLIHVADAPPHDSDAGAYLRAAKAAAGEGVQIFTLGASGVAAESEFLMRQVSVATGGRYLFLTDDSGVGNTHAEPTIPCYRVTRLASLLTSVLATELSGHRQEPGGVLRQVGSPRGGVCAD